MVQKRANVGKAEPFSKPDSESMVPVWYYGRNLLYRKSKFHLLKASIFPNLSLNPID